MEPEPEVLALERPRRTTPRVAAVLAALALAVGTAGWFVDHHRREGEAAALSSCRSELVETVGRISYRLGAMAEYWRPAWSTLDGRRAREVADHLRRPARSAADELGPVRRSCAGIAVWPWHGETASLRSATLAYADAWLDRLDAVARRGDAWFRPDDLSALRARARLT